MMYVPGIVLFNPVTPVYKHHNNTIRLTIQYKAALTTLQTQVVSAALCCIVRRIVSL